MGSNTDIAGKPSMAIHHQLMGIWERLLGAPVDSIDDSLFELGGHSLLLPQLMEDVRLATGRDVLITAFLACPTVRHLASCILKQTQSDELFTCVQEGSPGEVPFYFFHGDILGGGFYAMRLAEVLGPHRPFHISPPLELKEHELPRVEELAARKLAALRKRQPHGPYLLGGFCVGGVVAYEVARQLEAEGEVVQDVILIEPEIGDTLSRFHLRVVNGIAARGRMPREKVAKYIRGVQKVDRLRDVCNAPLRETARFMVNSGRKIFTGRSHAQPANPEPDSAAQGRDWLISAYQWVLTSYVPKPYRGRVTIFSTGELKSQAPYILKQMEKAAPQTRVEPIPGEHLTCITHHVEAIGGKIRAEIERACALANMLFIEIGSELPPLI